MSNQDNMQKYIDEMMRLYSQNSAENASAKAQIDTKATDTEKNDTEQNENSADAAQLLDLAPVELAQNPLPNDKAGQSANSDFGFLQVSVTAGEKAFPLENAVVVITQKALLGQSAVNVSLTDKSGKTPVITLPAPDNSDKSNANTAFSTYTAEVFLEGFYAVRNENVPIFSKITSLLPVNMVPLPSDATSRREITFYSNEPQF